MKKLSLLFVFVSILVTSCSKSDNGSSGADFSIDGIHDITLDITTPGANVLPIGVSRGISGSQENVTLSLSGLPTGVSATINPNSGVPSFASTITFSYDQTGTPGSYPVKLVGTSASGSKSYDMKITIPSFNGFVINGTTYNNVAVTHSSNTNFWYISAMSGSDGVLLKFYDNTPLPTAAATTYDLVEYPINQNQIGLVAGTGSSQYVPVTGNTVKGIVRFKAGKYSFEAINVPVARQFTGTSPTTLSCAFSE